MRESAGELSGRSEGSRLEIFGDMDRDGRLLVVCFARGALNPGVRCGAYEIFTFQRANWMPRSLSFVNLQFQFCIRLAFT
jgi:hypothetical protein